MVVLVLRPVRSFIDTVVYRNAIVAARGEQVDERYPSNRFVLIAAPVVADQFILRRPAFVEHGIINDEGALFVYCCLHVFPEMRRSVCSCRKKTRDGVVCGSVDGFV